MITIQPASKPWATRCRKETIDIYSNTRSTAIYGYQLTSIVTATVAGLVLRLASCGDTKPTPHVPRRAAPTTSDASGPRKREWVGELQISEVKHLVHVTIVANQAAVNGTISYPASEITDIPLSAISLEPALSALRGMDSRLRSRCLMARRLAISNGSFLDWSIRS